MKHRVDGCDAAGAPKMLEKKLSFGTYPEVSLKEARNRTDPVFARGPDVGHSARPQHFMTEGYAISTEMISSYCMSIDIKAQSLIVIPCMSLLPPPPTSSRQRLIR